MRCKTCHYSLTGLTEHRCPECGNAFDPNDPNTFEHAPFPPNAWRYFSNAILLVLGTYLAGMLFHWIRVSADHTVHPDHGVAMADWGWSFKALTAAYLAWRTSLYLVPPILLGYLVFSIVSRTTRR